MCIPYTSLSSLFLYQYLKQKQLTIGEIIQVIYHLLFFKISQLLKVWQELCL